MEPEPAATKVVASEVADGFLDFLIIAAEDNLKGRDLAILDGRFGIFGGEGQTLQEVGDTYRLSRERIRQIVYKSLRKLVGKGSREVRKGQLDEPCAQLITYVRDNIRPGEEGDVDRLLALATEELAHLSLRRQAIPLLAYFLGGKKGILQYRRLAAERLKDFYLEQRHERYQQLLAEQFQSLLQDVIWPGRPTRLDEHSFTTFTAQRAISADSLGYTGTFYSQKLQREVAYESELERRFLEQLERLEDVVFYQEQPLQIPYRVQASRRTYFPDVFFVLRDGRGVVVEVKPRNEMALYANWTKWVGLRHYCHQHGYGFLVTNGRYSLQDVRRREVRAPVRLALLAAVQNGPLVWPEYKALREQCGITTSELYALVIQERLVWRLRPSQLQVAP